ncbi:hypothetical protein EUGRSUZ_E01508 [Eucalyptus grandis]|uniref:Uncharacterized protein n=2 Tax=Eucalyptus grandis TaxID=71139 RepID=A0ACC3KWP5_EUCGR|nr:hypothetical protein EUGRSUZ_E01508 [Eucalyptus grandis]
MLIRPNCLNAHLQSATSLTIQIWQTNLSIPSISLAKNPAEVMTTQHHNIFWHSIVIQDNPTPGQQSNNL